MAVVRGVQRFDIVLVELDPTVGSEIYKTRPCLVISPDELNRPMRTVIIAPMTSGGRRYVTRVPIRFQGRDGHVALDRIRTIDKRRIVRRLGRADRAVSAAVVARIIDIFAFDR